MNERNLNTKPVKENKENNINNKKNGIIILFFIITFLQLYTGLWFSVG